MRPTLVFSTILLAVLSCNQGGPAIVVGSQTFNESTIQKEMPDFYKQLKSQYNQQLYQYLKRMATQRLVELAAEEAGKKPQEYMNGLLAKIPRPTEQEIQAAFQEMQAAGMAGGKPLSELRSQIETYVMNEKKELAIAKKLGQLRHKYGYKDSFEIRQDISTEGAASRGNPDAPITVIEFSDFECPYCARAQTTTRKLRRIYGDKIRFVFRHFPLDFHKHAMYAHKMSICIQKQSTPKFWKFFDELFARHARDRSALQKDKVNAVAQSLGANMPALQKCVEEPATKEQIQSDLAMGGKAGVSGTPAFFINGRFINGAVPLREFVSIIEEELAK